MSRVKFTDVAAGKHHSLALDIHGNVWVWGYNSDGQLGLGQDVVYAEEPTLLDEFDEPIKQVSAGTCHSAALDIYGFVYTWGCNSYGQLGVGDYETRWGPTNVEFPYAVEYIKAGDYELEVDPVDPVDPGVDLDQEWPHEFIGIDQFGVVHDPNYFWETTDYGNITDATTDEKLVMDLIYGEKVINSVFPDFTIFDLDEYKSKLQFPEALLEMIEFESNQFDFKHWFSSNSSITENKTQDIYVRRVEDADDNELREIVIRETGSLPQRQYFSRYKSPVNPDYIFNFVAYLEGVSKDNQPSGLSVFNIDILPENDSSNCWKGTDSDQCFIASDDLGINKFNVYITQDIVYHDGVRYIFRGWEKHLGDVVVLNFSDNNYFQTKTKYSDDEELTTEYATILELDLSNDYLLQGTYYAKFERLERIGYNHTFYGVDKFGVPYRPKEFIENSTHTDIREFDDRARMLIAKEHTVYTSAYKTSTIADINEYKIERFPEALRDKVNIIDTVRNFNTWANISMRQISDDSSNFPYIRSLNEETVKRELVLRELSQETSRTYFAYYDVDTDPNIFIHFISILRDSSNRPLEFMDYDIGSVFNVVGTDEKGCWKNTSDFTNCYITENDINDDTLIVKIKSPVVYYEGMKYVFTGWRKYIGENFEVFNDTELGHFYHSPILDYDDNHEELETEHPTVLIFDLNSPKPIYGEFEAHFRAVSDSAPDYYFYNFDNFSNRININKTYNSTSHTDPFVENQTDRLILDIDYNKEVDITLNKTTDIIQANPKPNSMPYDLAEQIEIIGDKYNLKYWVGDDRISQSTINPTVKDGNEYNIMTLVGTDILVDNRRYFSGYYEVATNPEKFVWFSAMLQHRRRFAISWSQPIPRGNPNIFSIGGEDANPWEGSTQHGVYKIVDNVESDTFDVQALEEVHTLGIIHRFTHWVAPHNDIILQSYERMQNQHSWWNPHFDREWLNTTNVNPELIIPEEDYSVHNPSRYTLLRFDKNNDMLLSGKYNAQYRQHRSISYTIRSSTERGRYIPIRRAIYNDGDMRGHVRRIARRIWRNRAIIDIDTYERLELIAGERQPVTGWRTISIRRGFDLPTRSQTADRIFYEFVRWELSDGSHISADPNRNPHVEPANLDDVDGNEDSILLDNMLRKLVIIGGDKVLPSNQNGLSYIARFRPAAEYIFEFRSYIDTPIDIDQPDDFNVFDIFGGESGCWNNSPDLSENCQFEIHSDDINNGDTFTITAQYDFTYQGRRYVFDHWVGPEGVIPTDYENPTLVNSRDEDSESKLYNVLRFRHQRSSLITGTYTAIYKYAVPDCKVSFHSKLNNNLEPDNRNVFTDVGDDNGCWNEHNLDVYGCVRELFRDEHFYIEADENFLYDGFRYVFDHWLEPDGSVLERDTFRGIRSAARRLHLHNNGRLPCGIYTAVYQLMSTEDPSDLVCYDDDNIPNCSLSFRTIMRHRERTLQFREDVLVNTITSVTRVQNPHVYPLAINNTTAACTGIVEFDGEDERNLCNTTWDKGEEVIVVADPYIEYSRDGKTYNMVIDWGNMLTIEQIEKRIQIKRSGEDPNNLPDEPIEIPPSPYKLNENELAIIFKSSEFPTTGTYHCNYSIDNKLSNVYQSRGIWSATEFYNNYLGFVENEKINVHLYENFPENKLAIIIAIRSSGNGSGKITIDNLPDQSNVIVSDLEIVNNKIEEELSWFDEYDIVIDNIESFDYINIRIDDYDGIDAFKIYSSNDKKTYEDGFSLPSIPDTPDPREIPDFDDSKPYFNVIVNVNGPSVVSSNPGGIHAHNTQVSHSYNLEDLHDDMTIYLAAYPDIGYEVAYWVGDVIQFDSSDFVLTGDWYWRRTWRSRRRIVQSDYTFENGNHIVTTTRQSDYDRIEVNDYIYASRDSIDERAIVINKFEDEEEEKYIIVLSHNYRGSDHTGLIYHHRPEGRVDDIVELEVPGFRLRGNTYNFENNSDIITTYSRNEYDRVNIGDYIVPEGYDGDSQYRVIDKYYEDLYDDIPELHEYKYYIKLDKVFDGNTIDDTSIYHFIHNRNFYVEAVIQRTQRCIGEHLYKQSTEHPNKWILEENTDIIVYEDDNLSKHQYRYLSGINEIRINSDCSVKHCGSYSVTYEAYDEYEEELSPTTEPPVTTGPPGTTTTEPPGTTTTEPPGTTTTEPPVTTGPPGTTTTEPPIVGTTTTEPPVTTELPDLDKYEYKFVAVDQYDQLISTNDFFEYANYSDYKTLTSNAVYINLSDPDDTDEINPQLGDDILDRIELVAKDLIRVSSGFYQFERWLFRYKGYEEDDDDVIVTSFIRNNPYVTQVDDNSSKNRKIIYDPNEELDLIKRICSAQYRYIPNSEITMPPDKYLLSKSDSEYIVAAINDYGQYINPENAIEDIEDGNFNQTKRIVRVRPEVDISEDSRGQIIRTERIVTVLPYKFITMEYSDSVTRIYEFDRWIYAHDDINNRIIDESNNPYVQYIDGEFIQDHRKLVINPRQELDDKRFYVAKYSLSSHVIDKSYRPQDNEFHVVFGNGHEAVFDSSQFLDEMSMEQYHIDPYRIIVDTTNYENDVIITPKYNPNMYIIDTVRLDSVLPLNNMHEISDYLYYHTYRFNRWLYAINQNEISVNDSNPTVNHIDGDPEYIFRQLVFKNNESLTSYDRFYKAEYILTDKERLLYYSWFSSIVETVSRDGNIQYANDQLLSSIMQVYDNEALNLIQIIDGEEKTKDDLFIVDSKDNITIVSNITERDNLESVNEGDKVCVIDASDDPTISVGGAIYLYDDNQWIRYKQFGEDSIYVIVTDEKIEYYEIENSEWELRYSADDLIVYEIYNHRVYYNYVNNNWESTKTLSSEQKLEVYVQNDETVDSHGAIYSFNTSNMEWDFEYKSDSWNVFDIVGTHMGCWRNSAVDNCYVIYHKDDMDGDEFIVTAQPNFEFAGRQFIFDRWINIFGRIQPEYDPNPKIEGELLNQLRFTKDKESFVDSEYVAIYRESVLYFTSVLESKEIDAETGNIISSLQPIDDQPSYYSVFKDHDGNEIGTEFGCWKDSEEKEDCYIYVTRDMMTEGKITKIEPQLSYLHRGRDYIFSHWSDPDGNIVTEENENPKLVELNNNESERLVVLQFDNSEFNDIIYGHYTAHYVYVEQFETTTAETTDPPGTTTTEPPVITEPPIVQPPDQDDPQYENYVFFQLYANNLGENYPNKKLIDLDHVSSNGCWEDFEDRGCYIDFIEEHYVHQEDPDDPTEWWEESIIYLDKGGTTEEWYRYDDLSEGNQISYKEVEISTRPWFRHGTRNYMFQYWLGPNGQIPYEGDVSDDESPVVRQLGGEGKYAILVFKNTKEMENYPGRYRAVYLTEEPLITRDPDKFVAPVEIVKTSAGGYHTLFLEGRADPENPSLVLEYKRTFSTGRNDYGQLGLGNFENVSSPHVIDLPNDVTLQDISAGYLHSTGIDLDGNGWAWGDNRYCQLGIDENVSYRNRPTKMRIPEDMGDKLKKISAGFRQTIGITDTNRAVLWGNSVCGFDFDSPKDSVKETTLPDGIEFVEVFIGDDYYAGLTEDGDVYMWGNNIFGQLGTGDFDNRDDPTLIDMPHDVTFQTLSLNTTHTMALDTNNNIWTWGNNEQEQIGDQTKVNRNQPVRVEKFSLDPLPEYEPPYIPEYSEFELDPEKDSYNVIVKVDGNGDVVSNPGGIICSTNEECQHEYNENIRFRLYAIPKTGYYFVEWKGDIEGVTLNSPSIIIDDDKYIEAIFKRKTITLGDDTLYGSEDDGRLWVDNDGNKYWIDRDYMIHRWGEEEPEIINYMFSVDEDGYRHRIFTHIQAGDGYSYARDYEGQHYTWGLGSPYHKYSESVSEQRKPPTDKRVRLVVTNHNRLLGTVIGTYRTEEIDCGFDCVARIFINDEPTMECVPNDNAIPSKWIIDDKITIHHLGDGDGLIDIHHNSNNYFEIEAIPEDGSEFRRMFGDFSNLRDNFGLVYADDDEHRTIYVEFGRTRDRMRLRIHSRYFTVQDSENDIYVENEVKDIYLPYLTNVNLERVGIKPGYIFDGWSGHGTSHTHDSRSIVMDSDKEVYLDWDNQFERVDMLKWDESLLKVNHNLEEGQAEHQYEVQKYGDVELELIPQDTQDIYSFVYDNVEIEMVNGVSDFIVTRREDGSLLIEPEINEDLYGFNRWTGDFTSIDGQTIVVSPTKRRRKVQLILESSPSPGTIVPSDYIIAFCDESATVYTNSSGTSGTQQWEDDVERWNAEFRSFNTSMIRMFDVERDHNSNHVYPRHDDNASSPPIQVDICPRNNPEILVNGEAFTADWLKSRVDEICPNPQNMSITPRLVIFIDDSGSMSRSAIAEGLNEFHDKYGHLYNITEVECSNEQWLLWFMNAAEGNTSICN